MIEATSSASSAPDERRRDPGRARPPARVRREAVHRPATSSRGATSSGSAATAAMRSSTPFSGARRPTLRMTRVRPRRPTAAAPRRVRLPIAGWKRSRSIPNRYRSSRSLDDAPGAIACDRIVSGDERDLHAPQNEAVEHAERGPQETLSQGGDGPPAEERSRQNRSVSTAAAEPCSITATRAAGDEPGDRPPRRRSQARPAGTSTVRRPRTAPARRGQRPCARCRRARAGSGTDGSTEPPSATVGTPSEARFGPRLTIETSPRAASRGTQSRSTLSVPAGDDAPHHDHETNGPLGGLCGSVRAPRHRQVPGWRRPRAACRRPLLRR